MRIKVVSFDVEGTLITRRFSEIIWEEAIPKLYSEKVGISLDEAKSYVMEEYDVVGEERVEWYDIKYWFDRFGLTDYRNLLDKYKHEISYYPEVQQVLEELSRNYKLIVNSNSAREFLDFEINKVKKYFHRVFSAPSDFKLVKKTVNLYLRMCDILRVKPTEMVHVGDLWTDDFVTPRKIGILSFYLDRKGEKRGEFIVKNLEEFKTAVKDLEKGNVFKEEF